MSNQELIDRSFEAYLKRDVEGVKSVMAENETWTILGLPSACRSESWHN
jgi:hypothetical protein